MAELIVRRAGAAGWIVFSNPAKHNAVTYDMIRALPIWSRSSRRGLRSVSPTRP